MKEIWKDIEGYEGLYQVSNLGRVKSLERIVKAGIINSDKRISRSKILNPGLTQFGYEKLSFSLANKRTTVYTHKLVAKTFIPNFENKTQINHINGIKTDNRVLNLEWCTASENIRHAVTTGLIKTGQNSKFSMGVVKCDFNGSVIKEYGSMKEASNDTGISSSQISRACNGIISQTNGFKWKFKS